MKNQKIWSMILLIAILCIGCGKSQEHRIAEQLELGQKYLMEGNYEQAIAAFNKVIELEPKNLEVYAKLSEIYLLQNKEDLSVQILNDGIHMYESMEPETLNELMATYKDLKQRLAASVEAMITSKLKDGAFEEAANIYRNMAVDNQIDEKLKKQIEDGAGFGKGLGNSPENQRGGGRKLIIGGYEIFLFDNKLYYEKGDQLVEFMSQQDYYLSGALNLTGNWIYGLGRYEGMKREEEESSYADQYLIRYNLLSQRWETLGLIRGVGIHSSSGVMISDNNIFCVQIREDVSGVSGQLWKMDLTGEGKTHVSTWQQIGGDYYIDNGYFYYRENSDYTDAPEILNYKPYDNRFAWQQDFRIRLDGELVEQVTDISLAAEEMKPNIVGEDFAFSVPMGGIRIPYNEHVYYFAGNVLFKTNENGTHYEIIKIFKTLDWYSDIPITGWEHGASHTQEEWAAIEAAYNSATDKQERIFAYQDNERFVIAVEEAILEEIENISSHKRGKTYARCYVFDMAEETFVEDETYKDAILQIQPGMGGIVFTDTYIYISETDEKNGYQSVRINKNTGKKEVLDESGSSV